MSRFFYGSLCIINLTYKLAFSLQHCAMLFTAHIVCMQKDITDISTFTIYYVCDFLRMLAFVTLALECIYGVINMWR